MPPGRMPSAYSPVAPDLVVEVRDAASSWAATRERSTEYLIAGVAAVVIADDETESILIHFSRGLTIKLEGDDELHLPDLLGDLRVPVRRLFE